MFRFLNKKIKDNKISRGINQIIKIIPAKSRLNSPGGQVAVILILLVALALIFYATTLNLSQVTQTKSITMVAADAGASRLASQMASYAQSILMTTLGGKIKVCKSTSLLSAIIKLVIVVIVCVIAPPSAPAMIALAIVGIALSVASVVLEMTVIQPGITEMWNKMMSNVLSFEDRFVEMGIQAGLMKAVTDPVQVDDVFDFDNDGEYVGTYGNADEAKISRFGIYYTKRLNSVTFPGHDDPNELVLDNGPIHDFMNELLDFTYWNYEPEFPWHRSQRAGVPRTAPSPVTDSWGLFNPPIYCPVPEPLPSGSNLIFSECNPCCLPKKVLNPTFDPTLPEHSIQNPLCIEIRDPCCDGEGGSECEGSEQTEWCENEYTSHYGEGDSIEFPFVFTPEYEDNSIVSGTSFMEQIGRDDETDAYMRCLRENRPEGTVCEDPLWDPNRVQQIKLDDPDLAHFRITDVTGFYSGGPYYYSYMNYPTDGIFRLFYELRDWSVELNRLLENGLFYKVGETDGLESRVTYHPENCYWADWDYLRDMDDYQIDCEQIIEDDPYFVMPWMLAPGQMSLPLDPRYEFVLCEKRPYVDTANSDAYYPIENFGDFCGPTLVPDRIALPGSFCVGCGGGPMPSPTPSGSPSGIPGGSDLGSSCGEDTYDSIIVPKEDKPPKEVCAQETVPISGNVNCDIIWREGGDRYCRDDFSHQIEDDPCGDTNAWPYFTKCDKFYKPDGTGCFDQMMYENESGGGVDAGTTDTNCTCPQVIVDGDRSQVEKWPDDILDDIVYGLKDFIDWSETLMNHSMLYLYRDFFKWYDDAANWIEPNSNVTGGIRNSGDNPCFVCFNDQNQNGQYDSERTDEILWGRLREIQTKMGVVWDRLHRMYSGINYSGSSCDQVWCVPPGQKYNEWCVIPDQPPEYDEREERTFDWNENDIRGDMEDTIACLDWNVNHSRVDGCTGNDGKFGCCYNGCVDLQSCTEDTCPDILPKTIEKCEYLPRSLIPTMDPRHYLEPWSDFMTLVRCRDDSAANPLEEIPECAEDCEHIPEMDFGSYRANRRSSSPNFITADQEAALNAEWVPPVFHSESVETPELLSFLSDVNDDWTYAVSQGWSSDAGAFAACLNAVSHEDYLARCSGLPVSHIALPSPPPSPMPSDFPSPAPVYYYSSGANPDPGSQLVVEDPGTCGDGAFFAALDQAIWVALQSCSDYGENYLLDIQGSAGDRRVPENLGWMDDVSQSWIEAGNQVAKFAHRLSFLNHIAGDMKKIMYLFGGSLNTVNGGGGWTRINDFIENFAEPLTRHRIMLAELDEASTRSRSGNQKKGLPYRAVYGWQDKPDLRKGEIAGQWHVVRVDARTPLRCDYACDPSQSGQQEWPTVRTETHNMSTKRCYFMVNYTGTVKFRVQRYDQIRDEDDELSTREPLTFENGTSIWDFRQYHPGGQYNIPVTSLGQDCAAALEPNPPSDLYDVGGLPGYTDVPGEGKMLYWGAFILNNKYEYNDGGRCWATAHQLLSQGVMSETCAQYLYAPYTNSNLGFWQRLFGEFSDRGGFTHRFVPCKKIGGQSW